MWQTHFSVFLGNLGGPKSNAICHSTNFCRKPGPQQYQYHGGPLPHDQNLQISRHHFQNSYKPWVVSCKPSLTNPGTTKSRLRKFRGAKVQTQKYIEQNYNFFFLTFSTLHLCTLQIFTIYFGCSGSIGCENSHDLPSPLPPQNNARITLHACSTLRLEGQHCLVGVRGREHEP